MSSVFPPDFTQALQNHQRRIRALEQTTPPTPGTDVDTTDGVTSVNPTSLLDIGAGLVLTNPAAGEAKITTPFYQSYAVTLDAVPGTGTAPTLGTGAASGSYLQINELVHVYGQISFNGFPTIGTGIWRINVPVAFGSQVAGHATLWGLNGGASEQIFQFIPNVVLHTGEDGNHFELTYCATPPVGLYKEFDSTSGWTLAAGDVLWWSYVYRASGGL